MHPYNLPSYRRPMIPLGVPRHPGRRCLPESAASRPSIDSGSTSPIAAEPVDKNSALSNGFDRSPSLNRNTQPPSVREASVRLEAVLFLSREPVPLRRLAQLADLPEGTRVRALLAQLNRSYAEQRTAFQIVEVAGGFQLRTRPQFAPWLFRLQEVPVEIRLSTPAMETLAVIVYKQPVLRAEIEAVRGVQCGEMIRQLLDLDLIRIAGRSEELGRPFLYGTTPRFLQVFGLKNLREILAEAEPSDLATSSTEPSQPDAEETRDAVSSESELPGDGDG